MNEATSLSVLLLAAVGIGAVHALAPDHWLPIAAVARARDYGRRRTALLTVLCGLVHLAVSASLGLVALRLGSVWAVAVADRLAALAGSLAIVGGLTWAAWSLHRTLSRPGEAVGQRFLRFGLGGLVLFFALDACVALVPLTFIAASRGALAAGLVVGLYGLSTLVVMLALTVPVQAGLRLWRGAGFARWGQVATGGAVAAVAVVMALLGG